MLDQFRPLNAFQNFFSSDMCPIPLIGRIRREAHRLSLT